MWSGSWGGAMVRVTLLPRIRPAEVALVASLLGVAASGCFRQWGSDFGGGAMTAARDGSVALVGQLRDSVVGIAVRTYDDSVRPRLTATLSAAFDSTQLRVAVVESTSAAFVEGRLSQALRALIAENLAVARDSVRSALGAWGEEAGRVARAELLPLASDVASSAAAGAVATLNAGLQGPLRSSVLALVMEVADSVRVAARRTAEEPLVKSLFERLGLIGGLVVGGIIAAVLAALALLGLNLLNTRRALQAVTTAIREAGTPDVRRAVKERARAGRVEGWLHDYLAKKDLLHTDPEGPS